MNADTYKNVIIGSGAGGKLLAWHLASSGEPTVVIERRWVGGSCPNVNCLPSKNEIWSAEVAHRVRHAARFGTMTGSVSIDMKVVYQRKREMVEGLVAMHLAKYKASGAELVMGTARLLGAHTVEVSLNGGGTRRVRGERLFLNLGTYAAMPALPGLAETAPMTNIEALELDRLPEHFLILGGGFVGVEFAQAYRRFGSRVTILQQGPRLLSGQDPDVSEAMEQLLRDEGIDVVVSADIRRVEGRSGSTVRILLRTPSGDKTIEGSDLLVAAGRRPSTAGIGLEAAGIALDSRGFIQVNDRLETTVPNVWGIGEGAGSPQFTHASEDDFRIIRDNLAGGNRSTRDRIVPFCLFTDPPLAHVGLTETEARRRVPVRILKMPIAGVLRTRTTGETRGFMKALIGDDQRVVGFTMLGDQAGEVMSVVQTAMLAGLPSTKLRDAIYTHPTMSEGLTGLFAQEKGENSNAHPIVDGAYNRRN
jgi:pyruvate/2-oxoglutarate dehydrogenase complex dihydrolipoamide dehydrogenase (E3) component